MSRRAEVGLDSSEIQTAASSSSIAYRRYALAILTIINLLAYLDRSVINILAEPIKRSLHLADWQIGMMTGVAFAAFYTVLGIPIARLAERYSRPRIIGIAIAIWSALTVLCGFARNFAQLFAARVGVGFGEAGFNPSAISMITDDTPGTRRAFALSLYSLGSYLGSVTGFALGGIVAGAFGWRSAFFLAGAPGLLFALLAALTLNEPRLRDGNSAPKQPSSLSDTIAQLAHKRAYWLICCASACATFLSSSGAAFVAPFYLRNHTHEIAQIAHDLKLTSIGFLGMALGGGVLMGAIGSLIGGRIADWASQRDLRALLAVPAFAALAAVPVNVSWMLSPSAIIALPLFYVSLLLSGFWFGPLYAATQGLVPVDARATSAAIQFLIASVVGLGLGPLTLGGLSDLYAHSLGLGPAGGLRWAFVTCELITLTLALLLLIARRAVVADASTQPDWRQQ